MNTFFLSLLQPQRRLKKRKDFVIRRKPNIFVQIETKKGRIVIHECIEGLEIMVHYKIHCGQSFVFKSKFDCEMKADHVSSLMNFSPNCGYKMNLLLRHLYLFQYYIHWVTIGDIKIDMRCIHKHQFKSEKEECFHDVVQNEKHKLMARKRVTRTLKSKKLQVPDHFL
jgi:hypothetical protein